jgi:hypothetical protein
MQVESKESQISKEDRAKSRSKSRENIVSKANQMMVSLYLSVNSR